jgi:hypothetical protein
MQLPFVLQSAETMKAAVAFLEPHMERVDGESRGKIVLATVAGPGEILVTDRAAAAAGLSDPLERRSLRLKGKREDTGVAVLSIRDSGGATGSRNE